MNSLELGLVGNCAINALVDRDGTIVWSCFPRFDGDPVFSRLLDEDGERGFFAVEVAGTVRREQAYIENTAVLVTRLWDRRGRGVEITDLAPRFEAMGRMFRPAQLVRTIRPLGEAPRITPEELAARLAGDHPPIVLDVRTRSQYDQDTGQIPGSVRVPPDQVEAWAARESRARSVVAYCT